MITKGFVVFQNYSADEIILIQNYAVEWLSGLIFSQIQSPLFGPIDKYHKWQEKCKIDHQKLLTAKNRHCRPTKEIKQCIINSNLAKVIEILEPGTASKLWDEGLGWLAFRLIRPGFKDGYPWSCKLWGPAKNCISVWLPVVGHGPLDTLAIWKGSNNKRLKRYLPKETKFTKDEYRLVDEPETENIIRPTLAKNEIIIFGPKTIHSEDVDEGDKTRFSLEFRFQLLPKS